MSLSARQVFAFIQKTNILCYHLHLESKKTKQLNVYNNTET